MSESACGGASSSSDADDKEFSCDECGKGYKSLEGYRNHMTKCCPENLYGCPSCDKLLLSELGVKRHHSRTHNESLTVVSRPCSYCGDMVEQQKCRIKRYDNAFCDTDCKAKWQSEQGGHTHALSEKIETSCDNCGKTIYRVESKVSRSEHNFCGFECYGEHRSRNYRGENNPRWDGGSPNDYGPDWPKMRRKALKRDGYQCVICGKSKEELGMNPDVHHIKPVKSFDTPNDANYLDNLVTLCRNHHKKWEGIPLKPQLI